MSHPGYSHRYLLDKLGLVGEVSTEERTGLGLAHSVLRRGGFSEV